MITIQSDSEQPSNQYAFSEEHRDKSKFVVRQMYTVSLRRGEPYYFCLLLHHVKGTTSYIDMRTIHEENCASLKEACRRRGLLIETM